jgi:methylated-DNA-protein-cysteine methyltransferase-like protein
MRSRDQLSTTTSSFEREVIRTIERLRPGEVASYGEIAEEAGYPRAARAVGTVLARIPDLPWWRVVRADGRLAAPRAQLQARLLKREGVKVFDGKVVDRR